jgi:hypothetical protein
VARGVAQVHRRSNRRQLFREPLVVRFGIRTEVTAETQEPGPELAVAFEVLSLQARAWAARRLTQVKTASSSAKGSAARASLVGG